MDYKNIFDLQNIHKMDFDQAKEADSLGIRPNTDAVREFFDAEQEREDAAMEHQNDLEERGFYFGTDCPFSNEQIERGHAFDDKMAMFMNEY